MSKADKYKKFFTDQFLMGPNSVRLLVEMLEKCPIDEGLRILDLGCGKGLTSLFLTKETKAQVFAVDLWVSATEIMSSLRSGILITPSYRYIRTQMICRLLMSSLMLL